MAIVDKPTETKPDYKVIGTRPIRHDGVDKVTGRAKYGADTNLTGMLFGSILRSPPRACSHQVDRHVEGRTGARRACGHYEQRHARDWQQNCRPGRRDVQSETT